MFRGSWLRYWVYSVLKFRSSHRKCSLKKGVLQNFLNQACNFIKKRLQHTSLFLWNLRNFLITPILFSAALFLSLSTLPFYIFVFVLFGLDPRKKKCYVFVFHCFTLLLSNFLHWTLLTGHFFSTWDRGRTSSFLNVCSKLLKIAYSFWKLFTLECNVTSL